MNNDKELFRQALQRQNERAARMKMPDDMEQRVMERVRHKKTIRRWLYLSTAAVAASVVLLLTFHVLNNQEVTKVEQPVVVKKTEPQRSEPKATERKPMPIAKEEKPVVAKTQVVGRQPKATTAVRETPATVSTTDSLDYYIDKIERELAQVDESLYIERMNKVIRADERLQRMVNSYILHTLDKEGRPQTAENMYNVKSEQDEE